MEDVEIRSEKIEEILSYIPHWIIRCGISLFFVVFFLLITITWFIKYPEIIVSTILITTEQPPAQILSKSSGKIQKIFIKDNQCVNKEDVLGVIENPANFDHVLKIKNMLKSPKNDFSNYVINNYEIFNREYFLGELQSVYAAFVTTVNSYKNFLTLNFHQKKINALNRQLKTYQLLNRQVQKQASIAEREFNLNKNQYERDSLLAVKNFYSKKELETSKSVVLQQEYSYEVSKSNLSNTQIQILQLQQSITDLELDHEMQIKQLESNLDKAYQDLLSQIASWEQHYLLITPVNGIVTFINYWSVNQNVNLGDVVMTVVPDTGSKIIGKVKMPIPGSGKVKIDQKVLIKLDNYPYQEFGLIKGLVKQISKVPSLNNYYVLEIDLPEGLKTAYGKQIDFKSELIGSAEIITEDVRLIERFLNPIKSLLKNSPD